jgi:hypothetical protein
VRFAANVYSGFFARYGKLADGEAAELDSRLREDLTQALEDEGVPAELQPALLELMEVPPEKRPDQPAPTGDGAAEIGPIIPGAIWGVRALMSTPTGGRIMAQAAQKFAPTILKFGNDARSGVRLLNI